MASAMAFSSKLRAFRYLWSSATVKTRLVFDKSMQVGGPFYIVLAVTLISCIIYLFYATILPSIYSVNSLMGISHVAISIWLIVNVFFNYFYCIKTDPGGPADTIDVELQSVSQNSGQEASGVTMRWCKSCQKGKPPMTHHCHICKRCILKMDHHCPWMHNCVGFFNYRFFFLFLFYLWIGCAYTTYMASIPLQASDENEEDNHILFTFVLAIAVFFSSTGLFWFHVYLVLTAQTTIDFYAYRRRRRQAKLEARQRGEKFSAPPHANPYDLGKIRNLRTLFDRGGAYWWLVMFLPHRLPPKGDGVHFTQRFGNEYGETASLRYENGDVDSQVERNSQVNVSRH